MKCSIFLPAFLLCSLSMPLAAAEDLDFDEESVRVNYSLGDAPPVDLEAYRDYLGPELWARSQALRDEVDRIWERGLDEPAPNVPGLGRLLPTGLLVANLYAQWILLEDFFREELAGLMVRGVRVADSLAWRCTAPWIGSARKAATESTPSSSIFSSSRRAATMPYSSGERSPPLSYQ